MAVLANYLWNTNEDHSNLADKVSLSDLPLLREVLEILEKRPSITVERSKISNTGLHISYSGVYNAVNVHYIKELRRWGTSPQTCTGCCCHGQQP